MLNLLLVIVPPLNDKFPEDIKPVSWSIIVVIILFFVGAELLEKDRKKKK